MKTDNRDFFRTVTLAICGSLDIEESLYQSFLALREWIPLDRLYIELYEAEMNCMRVIALATAEGGENQDVLFPLPEEAKNQTKEVRATVEADPSHSIQIINRPESDPLAMYLLETAHIPVSSILGMPLIIAGEPFGAIVLSAEGNDRYKEEHGKLLAMLREPFSIALSNALRHRSILGLKNLLADDNRFLHRELHRKSGDNIVGADFGLREVMALIEQVAVLDSPVLLLGETGTGKDIIANAIHHLSPRRDNPFIAVNCGGIPDNLIDSELFGFEKGAFTGAVAQKRGRFERADKGTIFLDEIGELPPQAQVRLLRVLQNKEIERIGGIGPVSLDIRVIAATNRHLEEMVKQGEFREDLWFRLNVFPIMIPALRDRSSDIPALVQHFILQKSRELKLPAIPPIKPGATDKLMEYAWPGNVRELENIVERSMILNPHGPISFEHTSPLKSDDRTRSVTVDAGSDILDAVITAHIQSILQKTDGKVHGPKGAAKRLGLNASTLRNKMNKLGIKYGKKKQRQDTRAPDP